MECYLMRFAYLAPNSDEQESLYIKGLHSGECIEVW